MIQKQKTTKPKICVVSTTRLAIHFFLKQHIKGLTAFSDVFLALNPENDVYTPDLQLPVRIVPIDIKREISIFADILALWQLYKLFCCEKPDLVWSVTPKGGLLGMLAARLAGVKRRVFVFQGEVWASRSGVMRWILKLADKTCASCATHLLAVSFLERSFLERENVVPVGRVQVLGSGSISGVDINRYKPDNEVRNAVRAELGISTDAEVALFVGRLTADKGLFELAKAFQAVALTNDNIHLVIVGPDEQKITVKIKQLVGEAVAKCHILSFTHTPERFMAAADFFCLPSYREGFSMAVIEAAGAGIPTIGSNIPGVADTIEDGKTGILVRPGSSAALQTAIQRMAEDAAFRHQLGSAARQNVLNNFKSDDVVNRYVQFFRTLLP